MLTHPHQSHERRRGFTLLELVAGLLVLGALALIMIPSYNSVKQSSQDAVSFDIATNFASKANYMAAIANTSLTGQILTDSIEYNEIGVVITDGPVPAGATPAETIGWHIQVQDVSEGWNTAEAWVCIVDGRAQASLTECS